jgi:hypothetical protein
MAFAILELSDVDSFVFPGVFPTCTENEPPDCPAGTVMVAGDGTTTGFVDSRVTVSALVE